MTYTPFTFMWNLIRWKSAFKLRIIKERLGKAKKPVSFTHSLVFVDFSFSLLKEYSVIDPIHDYLGKL